MIQWLRQITRPNVGWLAIASAVGLTVMGIAAINVATLSATSPVNGVSGFGGGGGLTGIASRQVQFGLLAVGCMLLCTLPHHRQIAGVSYPILAVSVIMLMVVLLPFMPESFVKPINGSRRWFNLKLMNFQPSELAKVTYVLAMASYLRFRENYRRLMGLFAPLAITFIPMGLIVVEPDLGTALIFPVVMFAMLLAAGAKLRHIALIVIIGLMLMPVMYFTVMRPHQRVRIDAMISQFRGDERDDSGIGFQGRVARMLVGAGGIDGHEEQHATNMLAYNGLPERHNDMIFAVICARWGMAGGLVMLGLFGLLILSGLIAAGMNKDPFARLVSVGVTAIVFTQMVVNVGMTIGVLPITGMTLPFISYGGSSLLVNFAMVGLIVNVAMRRPIIIAEPAFEFSSRRGHERERNVQRYRAVGR